MSNVSVRWEKRYSLEKSLISTNRDDIKYKARLCGYLAGDGRIFYKEDYHHYAISFYPDHESIVRSYMDAFQRFYNKKPSVKKLNNFFYVSCNSKAIFYDLINTIDFGVRKWRAPYKILYNEINTAEWLRGLFDSDGSVNVKKKFVRLQSVNINGLRDVKKLLINLDINSFISKYNGNNSRGVAYELYIPKYSEVVKFYRKVSFYHKIKQDKLRFICDRNERNPNGAVV